MVPAILKKILLPALWTAALSTGMTACKNNETSSSTNEDSIKLVRMQSRLDSLERVLTSDKNANVAGQSVAEGDDSYGAERPPSGKPVRENLRRVPKAGKNFFARDMGNYPEGSNRLLTEKDLQHLSPWGYKLLLNEIYARHGMSFTDKELQDHFYKQPWYRTGRKNVDQSLSAIEKQNIEFLRNHPK